MDMLIDSEYYLKYIAKLHIRLLKKHALYKTDQQGISFSRVFFARKKIARLLVREILHKSYHLSSPVVKEIVKNNKKRTIYQSSLLDKLVLAALYETLSENQDLFLSCSVYSYIKGRAAKQAIIKLSNYLKSGRQKITNKKCDYYVLRGDLASYGDSIPIHDQSRLWSQLRELIQNNNIEVSEYYWSLIEASIRPILLASDAWPYQGIIGVPTGSSIANLCTNIYIKPLDDLLGTIPDGFYVRYGDDFIFIHTDINIFRQADSSVSQVLADLSLARKAQKEKHIYLTSAAKPCVDYPDLIGSNTIEFLGYSILANGKIGIGKRGIQLFLRTLRTRVKTCAKLLKNMSVEQKGRSLCYALNKMLSEHDRLRLLQVGRIIKEIDDRSILKSIDYQIALLVAEICSNVVGVKAFRSVPYKKIRQDWKLKSLCYSKDHKNG